MGAATISAGATRVPVYGLGFNVTSGSPNFSAVTFTTSGTYNASDILNFKFWECNFDVFPSSSAVQRGSTITTGLGPGSHTFSSLGITIPTGSLHCFYITVDIAPGAAGGHTIICNTITKANTIISGTNNYGTNLQGGTQTIAGALPVELLSFSGKNFGKENYLEWTTASEINNDYFTIEKSKNGIDFGAVGTVNGAGNSSHISGYSFTDKDPFAGINYYRLRQTDYNGETSLFQIISVYASLNAAYPFIVYPGITNDFINVFTGDTPDDFEITIVDMAGRTVMQTRQKNNINVSHLAGGFYSVMVNTAGTRYSQKFIKQ